MPTPFELREELQRLVVAELLGPANGPEETVTEPTVRDRYLVGLLAPKGGSALPEVSDAAPLAGVDGEDGVTEAPPPKAASSMLPSSIGLTFVVDATAEALQITARWGRYTRAEVEIPTAKSGGEAEFEAEAESESAPEPLAEASLETPDRDQVKSRHRRVWRRTPQEGVSPPIPLKPGRMEDWVPVPEQPGVIVQGLVRQRPAGWVVTLFLINAQAEPPSEKDTAWVFQPELSVAAPDGVPVFCKRVVPDENATLEARTLAMLYRREVEFAVGHGVAVESKFAPGEWERAVRLTTAVAPTCDIPQVTAPTVEEIPVLAGIALDMKTLSEIPDGQFGSALMALGDAYAAWIAEQAGRLDPVEPDLAPYLNAAQAAIEQCEVALTRIRAGIALLDADPRAAAAFRFANRAMYLQRIHTLYAQRRRREASPDWEAIEQPEHHQWRVFQLAFVLLNLPALTALHHPERVGTPDGGEPYADLLWFPTGGGKTEAYLGVAAYTLALRRLQGEIGSYSGHAGVAVLMRYTLRLLTLQQFQRATALICACEIIRQENPVIWGSEPFRIGLWVGRRSTPNYTQDAEEAVKQLRHGAFTREGTPYQLTNCPWCGAPIEKGRDLVVEPVEGGRGRTFIYCGDPLGRCPFSRKQAPDEGIPALVVDEEIYRRLPALLIATVDKFAQLPWNGRTAMLFGRVDGYCERHGFRSPELEDSDSHPANKKYGLPPARTLPAGPLRPPDLIIQDELHLISGPLGTLVGLYETAVEQLATWEVDGVTVRPKVIASTATVRQADMQVHSLFLRRVAIFPPNGLEASDNFFARQRMPTPEQPGRRYLGFCAPGIRQKTALIQTYLAFLAAAQLLYNRYSASVDPWMTLVGYFSSLRELGGMRRAVDDTVSTRLTQMGVRGLATRRLYPQDVQELTSRQSAADIPDILERLEAVFLPRENRTPGNYPIDVLLATNMISVGVDVGRLGLMVVANQPKNTAEYIQATSRVGRQFPGLVCTVYNWTRPRDLSHYERFVHYHATFYQHVEALSVTPFSPRAIDRGLTAVLAALFRLLDLRFNSNRGAEQIEADAAYVETLVDAILQRAGAIGGNATAELVRQALAARLDQWKATVPKQGAHLGYREEADGVTRGLLTAPGLTGWGRFDCLNSLRDVEPTVNLLLDDQGMDRPDAHEWVFETAPEVEEAEDELQRPETSG